MATALPKIDPTQTAQPDSGHEPTHEAIAILAYTIWEARGCPDDSAERDWLEAEQQLRSFNTEAANDTGAA